MSSNLAPNTPRFWSFAPNRAVQIFAAATILSLALAVVTCTPEPPRDGNEKEVAGYADPFHVAGTPRPTGPDKRPQDLADEILGRATPGPQTPKPSDFVDPLPPPGPGADTVLEHDGLDWPKPVDLRWKALESPEAEAQLTDFSLTAVARNLTDRDLVLKATLFADAGRPPQVRYSLDPIRLGAGDSAEFAVDLEAVGLRLDDMRFSGVAGLVAEIESAEGEQLAVELTPELFFHRGSDETDGLTIYGDRVLAKRYRFGDLRNAVADEDLDGVVRISDGGSGTPSPGPTRHLNDSPSFFGPSDEAPIDSEVAEQVVPAPVGAEAGFATYLVCMMWDITMNDSAFTAPTSGVSEDYYPWTSHTVVARNVRVQVSGLAFNTTIDTGEDGCFAFFAPVAPPVFTIRAFAYAVDSGNNVTRVIDTVGNTRSFVKVVVLPAGFWTVVTFGNFTSPWATLAAVSAYSAYRHRWGAVGNEMRVTECFTSSCTSSLVNLSQLANGIGTIQMYDGSAGGTDWRYSKFMISHELGHAWLRLYTGGLVEPFTSLTGLVDPSSSCSDGTGYKMDSLEWNVIGAKETVANIYSADIWNHHGSNTGVFRELGKSYDLEFNSPPINGGFIENNCSPANTFGKSVNLDWLRFYWDWHTPYGGGSKPPLQEIRDAWHLALLLDALATGNPGFAQFKLWPWNYYERMTSAMNITVDPQAWKDDWVFWAGFNGVDTN